MSHSVDKPKAAAGTTVKARAAFPDTRWTLVLAAGKGETIGDGRAALESLCRAYWYPVYAFIRRCGHPAEQAEDLTQEFFLRVLSGTFLSRATPEKGRFRSFLLGAVKHFLADASDRQRALKRGGGLEHLAMDFQDGDMRYLREPVSEETPERIFHRKWAKTVLGRVMTDLREEFVAEGKLDQFKRLKGYLSGSGEVKYAEVARDMQTTETALKSSIQRLRRRYRDLLRAEVAETVADASEVDGELRFLLGALSTREVEAH